ncbi:c-type cytochrome biogenesis protein CcmI [Neorhizobium sp. NCHU2750]|uniref:c-type cytochrome biogenesis protein CcmI n=1 Tax=Neorhizobium sp. NCHU2750 TaxID=1825976 RepID=UPI000E734FC5|nr:cytochrome c biogenesis protein [Neorhizobium sp. NCHU2750]
MILWILLALLTALVAAALLYPLYRHSGEVEPDNAGEVAVYRDQMKELDRDRLGNLISAEEAEYARAEIGRRLLSATAKNELAAGGKAKPSGWRKFAAVSVVVLPPVIGLCLYVMLGSPGLPDQPLAARLANPGNDINLLVAKAERHLAENPDDGAGWDVLAPIYFRTGRLGDAELAYRNAIRLNGSNAARLSGLGETLVASNDGVVTDDARSAFEEAVKLEPADVRAHFYIGMAQEQSGKVEDARKTFEDIARASPPDAPWMGLINEHIAKNGGKAAQAPVAPPSTLGGPTTEDVAAAQNMSQGDRMEMIRGMVDSLAEKLQSDPNNIEGWLRIVRSYMVLGDRDKAMAALKAGLDHFPPDGNEGRQLVALAGQLGLPADATSSQGATPDLAPAKGEQTRNAPDRGTSAQGVTAQGVTE